MAGDWRFGEALVRTLSMDTTTKENIERKLKGALSDLRHVISAAGDAAAVRSSASAAERKIKDAIAELEEVETE